MTNGGRWLGCGRSGALAVHGTVGGVVGVAARVVEWFVVALVASYRGERPARLRLTGRAATQPVTVGRLLIGVHFDPR